MEKTTAGSVTALMVYYMFKAGGKGIFIRYEQKKTGGCLVNYPSIGSRKAESKLKAEGPSCRSLGSLNTFAGYLHERNVFGLARKRNPTRRTNWRGAG